MAKGVLTTYKKATRSAMEVQQAAAWWEGKGLEKKQEDSECQGKHAWAPGQYSKEKRRVVFFESERGKLVRFISAVLLGGRAFGGISTLSH